MTKRILIVEDDDDIASIEKDYLEVSGYEVHVEEDGAKGLSEALTGIYDLFLLDVMLPNMDGFEICRKLRDKTDKPIMLVTAKREDIDKIRGLGYGADDYIAKPFSPGVLVAKVKAQLAQYDRLKGRRRKQSASRSATSCWNRIREESGSTARKRNFRTRNSSSLNS